MKLNFNHIKLFFISFAILYFELLCIRWTGAHILYLSYFSNFVLLGCFLGIGAGCLLARKEFDLFQFFPFFLALFVAIVAIFDFEVRIVSTEHIYFRSGFGRTPFPDFVVLPLIFIFVTILFTLMSQPLGKLFIQDAPLKVYTINILGSLAGIGIFSINSILSLPSWTWFLLLSIIIIFLMKRNKLILLNSLILIFTCVGVYIFEYDDFWSPYYRIRIYDMGEKSIRCDLDICLKNSGEKERILSAPHKLVKVNSIAHQFITDFRLKEPFYEFPYIAMESIGGKITDVLIIGAGGGIDTAFAIAYGSRNIDAVEIDPAFIELGKIFNPNMPYTDPRVNIYVDDGRAFLSRTNKLYDLIIYGLPDSLTLSTSLSNIRLESFLFTLESFNSAKARLKPDGLFVLYNYYREKWLIEKIAQMLEKVFGKSTATFVGSDKNLSAVFFAGHNIEKIPQNFAKDWGFKRLTLSEKTFKPSTDDWPFLYIKKPSISSSYVIELLLILIFSISLIFFITRVYFKQKKTFHAHFFFMGSAFLLLETMSIVRFSLLFGSTWSNNAIIFSMILIMVLLANLICFRFSLKREWLIYVFLFTSLSLQFLIPLNLFLVFEPLTRYFLAGIFIFSPVFFANLVFSRAFRETQACDFSYASNIIGAMFGGIFEYASIIMGYTFLTLFVAVFYALALLAIARK